MERIFAIAIMLSTYIAYGLILGRSAAILAGFTFRRQTFKRRFAIIRKYLVRLCYPVLILLHIHFVLQKRACIKEDLQAKVIKYYEYTVSLNEIHRIYLLTINLLIVTPAYSSISNENIHKSACIRLDNFVIIKLM